MFCNLDFKASVKAFVFVLLSYAAFISASVGFTCAFSSIPSSFVRSILVIIEPLPTLVMSESSVALIEFKAVVTLFTSVTSAFASILASLDISADVVNLFVVLVSLISSASKTTLPVWVFTEVTGKLVSCEPSPTKEVAVTLVAVRLPLLSSVTPVPLPLPSVISLADEPTSLLSVVFSNP